MAVDLRVCLLSDVAGWSEWQHPPVFSRRFEIEERTMQIRLSSALLFVAWCVTTVVTLAQDKPIPSRPPWTTSRVHGTPEPPAPYRLVPAFPQLRFELPTSIEEVPGTNRLLVTERGGKVFTFPKDAGTSQTDLVVDLRDLLPGELAGQAVSLFDAELHPKFRDNRYLFVCYVHPAGGGHTRVSRFTLTADAAPRAVPEASKSSSPGHRAATTPAAWSSAPTVISTLPRATARGRIRPTGGPRARTCPICWAHPANRRRSLDGRPALHQSRRTIRFVSTPNARPEIWAYGLRNPWKFGIDPQTGNIFAADNGWESWEMVHRIVRGGNCGWPVMEGRAALRSEVQPGPTPIIPPVKDHPHTEANSVIGGPVYRGEKLPDLAGSFVYGDYITGTIWAIRPDKDGAYSHRTLVDTDQRIVAFPQGQAASCMCSTTTSPARFTNCCRPMCQDTSASFPRRLSETGLFASLEKLEPAAGVVPYSVLVEPWMDGASGQTLGRDSRRRNDRTGERPERLPALSGRDGARKAPDAAATRTGAASAGNAAFALSKTASGIPTAICGTKRAATLNWSIRLARTVR